MGFLAFSLNERWIFHLAGFLQALHCFPVFEYSPSFPELQHYVCWKFVWYLCWMKSISTEQALPLGCSFGVVSSHTFFLMCCTTFTYIGSITVLHKYAWKISVVVFLLERNQFRPCRCACHWVTQTHKAFHSAGGRNPANETNSKSFSKWPPSRPKWAQFRNLFAATNILDWFPRSVLLWTKVRSWGSILTAKTVTAKSQDMSHLRAHATLVETAVLNI